VERVISRWGAVSVVAGSMLGVGIFLTPPMVARAVDSGPAFLALWLLGGTVALAGATVYAELGAMYPRAGGDYVFLREAFGDAVAFASGVVLFMGVFGGSIAAMSVALCQYQVAALLSGLLGGDWMPLAVGPWSGAQLLAVGVVVALTALNLAGAVVATRFQLVATAIPIVIIIVGAAWAMVAGSPTPAVGSTSVDGRAVVAAAAGVYFAYAGWNAAAYVAGEIRAPERALPFALLVGTAGVTALYLLACVGFVAALGLQGVRDAFEVGSATAAALAGEGASLVVAALILVALVGSVNATILGGARIGAAMAVAGHLPPGLAAGGPAGTPTRALLGQAAFACALILSGTFERLVELTSITMMLLSALTAAALFRLRRTRPGAPRPYRAPGYPWVPLVFLLACAGVIAVSLLEVSAPADDGSTLDRVMPVLGVALFAALAVGRRLMRRV
jgi:APA family basic amino acid/polyamine antiporter